MNRHDRPGEPPLRNPETGSEYRHPFGSQENSRARHGHIAIDGPPVWTEVGTSDSEWMRDLWSFSTAPLTLILIGFTALFLLPAALWTRAHSEDIVIWALENETVSESATRWLPDAIETGSTIATGILALAAIPAYVTFVAFARRAPLIRFFTDVIWGVALVIGRPLIPFVRTTREAVLLAAVLLARSVTLVVRIIVTALGVIRGSLLAMPVALIVVAWLSGRAFVALISATIAGLVWLITPPARAVTRTARYILVLLARPLYAALRGLEAAGDTLISCLQTLIAHLGRAVIVVGHALHVTLVRPIVLAAEALKRTAAAAINFVFSTITQALHWLAAIASRLAEATKRLSILALTTLASWGTTALAFVRTHVVEPPIRWFLSTLRFALLLLHAAAAEMARALMLVVSGIATTRAFVQRHVVNQAIRLSQALIHSINRAFHVVAEALRQANRLLSRTAVSVLATAREYVVSPAIHALQTALRMVGLLVQAMVTKIRRALIVALDAAATVVSATVALIATVWRAVALLTSTLARALTTAFGTLRMGFVTIALVLVTPFVYGARMLRDTAVAVLAVVRALVTTISSTAKKALAYVSRALSVVTHALHAIRAFFVVLFMLPARPVRAASLWIAGLTSAGWHFFARGLEVLRRVVLEALTAIGRVFSAIGSLLAAGAGILLQFLILATLPFRALAAGIALSFRFIGRVVERIDAFLQASLELISDIGTMLCRTSSRIGSAMVTPVVAAGGAYVGGLVSAGESVARWPWGRIASGGIVTAIVAAVIYGAMVAQPNPQVTVVHWSTGHLIRDGSGLRLLRQMAEEFNAQGHLSPSGKPIKVQVFYQGGAEQAPELISRVTTGTPIDKALPNPTLVTPSASHWLVNVNYAAGFEVINLNNTEDRSLARTYVGIVTYRDMANCLGWPEVEISFASLISLRNHPAGWASRDCANPDWGPRPLVAFTDPSSSDTGRAVLLSLYLTASGKDPATLTEQDLEQPAVVDYVRSFQTLVDHYMPSTIPLNTRVCEGPRYGHFFIMPEDNLVHLLDGTEKCLVNGIERNAPPLRGEMVIMYPKEGSLLRENCACAVKADWVDEEEAAATELWVEFLRKDAQQQSFVRAGFHPGTVMTGNDAGVSPVSSVTTAPQHILHPEQMDPAVARAIDQSWQIVKRPAIVTFVADTSGSMLGDKLRNEKTGLRQAIEEMASNNSVGLVTFGDTARRVVELGINNRDEMSRAVDGMRAAGETALYDAVRLGVSMTDAAHGPTDAIRAVVVITDGRANRGTTCMHDLVSMTSADERPIESFCGLEDQQAMEQGGREVTRTQVAGVGLAMGTTHPVQIFYVAIGKDADLDIGRILSGATGAEFRGVTEADLAEVILEFSHYF